mmetsp:Transcript_9926/g.21050  ORF Transcript_9926/g.21050 Transcript_9926/m.21050 type:complete len:798 (-) Transcript_9926:72-2465(-)
MAEVASPPKGRRPGPRQPRGRGENPEPKAPRLRSRAEATSSPWPGQRAPAPISPSQKLLDDLYEVVGKLAATARWPSPEELDDDFAASDGTAFTATFVHCDRVTKAIRAAAPNSAGMALSVVRNAFGTPGEERPGEEVLAIRMCDILKSEVRCLMTSGEPNYAQGVKVAVDLLDALVLLMPPASGVDKPFTMAVIPRLLECLIYSMMEAAGSRRWKDTGEHIKPILDFILSPRVVISAPAAFVLLLRSRLRGIVPSADPAAEDDEALPATRPSGKALWCLGVLSEHIKSAFPLDEEDIYAEDLAEMAQLVARLKQYLEGRPECMDEIVSTEEAVELAEPRRDVGGTRAEAVVELRSQMPAELRTSEPQAPKCQLQSLSSVGHASAPEEVATAGPLVASASTVSKEDLIHMFAELFDVEGCFEKLGLQLEVKLARLKALCEAGAEKKSVGESVESCCRSITTIVFTLAGLILKVKDEQIIGDLVRRLLSCILQGAELPENLRVSGVWPLIDFAISDELVHRTGKELWAQVQRACSPESPRAPEWVYAAGCLACEIKQRIESMADGQQTEDCAQTVQTMNILQWGALLHLTWLGYECPPQRRLGPALASTSASSFASCSRPEPASFEDHPAAERALEEAEDDESVALTGTEDSSVLSSDDNASDLDDFIDQRPEFNNCGFLTSSVEPPRASKASASKRQLGGRAVEELVADLQEFSEAKVLPDWKTQCSFILDKYGNQHPGSIAEQAKDLKAALPEVSTPPQKRRCLVDAGNQKESLATARPSSRAASSANRRSSIPEH